MLWQGTKDEETIYTNYDPVHNPDAPAVGYCRRKGTLPKSQRPSMEDAASLNVRVIRYADVLLWQAEAAAHNGSDWQTPLNAVRKRVGLGESPYKSDPLKAFITNGAWSWLWKAIAIGTLFAQARQLD